jgi:hypothetical protein
MEMVAFIYSPRDNLLDNGVGIEKKDGNAHRMWVRESVKC